MSEVCHASNNGLDGKDGSIAIRKPLWKKVTLHEEGIVTFSCLYKLCPMILLTSWFPCLWTLEMGRFPSLEPSLIPLLQNNLFITNVIPSSVLDVGDT